MRRLLANENVHRGIVKKLREMGYDTIYVPEIGLSGKTDKEILDYSEKNDLIIISGDKDFGGIIGFGELWGRGKIILLRYRFINISRIAEDIVTVLNNEFKTFESNKSVVVVLSEGGYRVHIASESN